MKRPALPFVLYGYIPYSETTPGFALPIFRNEDYGLAIQVAEPSGSAEFVRFISSGDNVVQTSKELTCYPGSPPVYVFIANSTEYIGTADQLAAVACQFRDNNPSLVAINLQIAEIIGSVDERRRARAEMISTLEQEAPPGTGERFSHTSLGYDVLWRVIFTNRRGDEVISALKKIRRELSSSFELPELQIARPSLWKRLAPLLNKSREQILTEIRTELPDSLYRDQPPKVPEGLRRQLDEVAVSSALDAVEAGSRQEQRLASLLAAYLEDTMSGLEAMRRFSPHGKAERTALEYLLTIMRERRLIEDDELRVAKAIRHVYSGWFPLQRGLLLLELAMQLGKYRHIADVIEERALTSRTLSVRRYAHQIMEQLGRPPTIA